jgi:hypothetical protein
MPVEHPGVKRYLGSTHLKEGIVPCEGFYLNPLFRHQLSFRVPPFLPRKSRIYIMRQIATVIHEFDARLRETGRIRRFGDCETLWWDPEQSGNVAVFELDNVEFEVARSTLALCCRRAATAN